MDEKDRLFIKDFKRLPMVASEQRLLDIIVRLDEENRSLEAALKLPCPSETKEIIYRQPYEYSIKTGYEKTSKGENPIVEIRISRKVESPEEILITAEKDLSWAVAKTKEEIGRLMGGKDAGQNTG